MKENALICVGVILVAIAMWFGIEWMARHVVCAEWGKITSIGGCSEDGNCGVMTDKGPSTESFPAIGQRVCLKTEFK